MPQIGALATANRTLARPAQLSQRRGLQRSSAAHKNDAVSLVQLPAPSRPLSPQQRRSTAVLVRAGPGGGGRGQGPGPGNAWGDKQQRKLDQQIVVGVGKCSLSSCLSSHA